MTLNGVMALTLRYFNQFAIHGLSRRYDGSHHHEYDLLWARSPIRERHIRWQIWHSKLLVDGGPDLRRSRFGLQPICYTCGTTYKRFLEHWTYWSKVGFRNTYSGEVSVRNYIHAFVKWSEIHRYLLEIYCLSFALPLRWCVVASGCCVAYVCAMFLRKSIVLCSTCRMSS